MQCVTEGCLESFRREIALQQWISLKDKQTADDAYNGFIKIFIHIYSKHFPFKVYRSSKKARKPWITREHLKKIKDKNRIYQSFLRTRSKDKFLEFKKFRNQLNKELRQAKFQYYEHLFENINKQRPEAAWKVMNNVLGREKNNILPDAMLLNGQELSGTALADYMNSYFVNVAASPHDALELTDQRISCVQIVYFSNRLMSAKFLLSSRDCETHEH